MATDSENIDKKAPSARQGSSAKLGPGTKTKGYGKDKNAVPQADTCTVCRTDFIGMMISFCYVRDVIH